MGVELWLEVGQGKQVTPAGLNVFDKIRHISRNSGGQNGQRS